MHKERIVILVAVIIILAGFLYWFFVLRERPSLSPIETEAGPEPASLGEELLEKSQNPIKGKVSELEPVVNPVEDLYKNPFE